MVPNVSTFLPQCLGQPHSNSQDPLGSSKFVSFLKHEQFWKALRADCPLQVGLVESSLYLTSTPKVETQGSEKMKQSKR